MSRDTQWDAQTHIKRLNSDFQYSKVLVNLGIIFESHHYVTENLDSLVLLLEESF